MESILKAIKKQKIPINPAVVISNKSNAKGLAIAKKMGLQTVVMIVQNTKERDYSLIKKLSQH